MSVHFKTAGQCEVAERLRAFADEVERGDALVTDVDQSLMQEQGAVPSWLLTLRWRRPAPQESHE